jgi:hypothetical protein
MIAVESTKLARMLAETYDRFAEDFDTADLKDAKALLEELGVDSPPSITSSQ